MTDLRHSEAAATGRDPGPLIRLAAVTKTYGSGEVQVDALRGIDLDVPEGQFVVVLGPSGSGKTTLMNLIGGIESPTSGSINVAGTDLTVVADKALTEYRRSRLGFVFQFFNLIPTLTALENVSLVAELVGASEEDAREALREVGLAERADHFPAAMSGGEQQRVAIARALVKNPSVLLADEPTGSLDLDTGRKVLATLHRASRDGHRIVLVVTHNSAIAAMADRVLRLGSGRVVDDRMIDRPISAERVSW